MIRVKSVSISGFRGIRQPMKLNFAAGFTVLTGANGSGKSSVIDAIEFALSGAISKYEEGSGEKGEKSSAYVWWRGNQPAPDRYVRVEFIDEGSAVTVVTRKPDSVSVETDSLLLNLLCDSEINPASSIEELCRTSIIRDELIAKNSVDLPETDRFSFVSAAVGAANTSVTESKLADASKLLKRRADEAQREYDRIRRQIQDQVEQLSAAKGQLADGRATAEAQERLRLALGMHAPTLEDLISATDNETRRLRAETTLLGGLVSTGLIVEERRSRLEVSGSIARHSELQTKVSELTDLHSISDAELASCISELQMIQKAQGFVSNLAQLHQAGRAIGRRSDGCPLCGLVIDEASFRVHLEELQAEVESHGAQVAAAVDRERNARSKEQALRNELETTKSALDRARSEIAAVEEQFESFTAEVARVAPERKGLAIGALQTELQTVRERLALIEQDRRMLAISDQADRILDLERDLEATKESSLAAEKQLTKARRIEEQLKDASATLKRIGAEAVEERLAAIRPLFTELFLRLRPHIDWKNVTYAVRGDVRRFLSLRVDEDLNLKFLFSSGQRRATGLAFLISVALSRPWCRFRSLVLDDPIQHVDDFRAVHLVETLAAIRTMRYQLICAVEDPALADLLTRRLRSSHYEAGTLVRMKYVSGDGAQVDEVRDIAPFDVTMLANAS